MTDFAAATVEEHVRALNDGEVSAVELVDGAIRRIEARDGAINAVVIRNFDAARSNAKAADQARKAGERRPLLGVPVTVKEAYATKGQPTTWGLEPLRDVLATEDAVAVQRLKNAGAIVLGKTNIPPGLGDWQSVNPIYGRTNNPHDLTKTPGGSSGGSAASLAAGYVPLEMGSDIGGSIRVPSALCGTFGHKPTWELIPMRGHAPAGISGAKVPLGVVGPMARTANDLDLTLSLLAGPDDDEGHGYKVALSAPRATRLKDFRVLVHDAHPISPTDPEVAAAVNALADDIAKAGAKVMRASPALPDLANAFQNYTAMLNTIISRIGPNTKSISAHAWMTELDVHERFRKQWAAFFKDIDVVLSPTFGVPAFPHNDDPAWEKRIMRVGDKDTRYGDQLGWPSIAAHAHLPSTAFPIGRTKSGLPLGAQAMGGYLDDRTTIAFAAAVEEELGRKAILAL
jgi:amidase